MPIRKLPLALGLLAVVRFAPPGSSQTDTREGKAPARVYTNEDLDRVHRLRDDTGVASVPASPPEPAPPEPRSSSRRHGEEYWRREAARVRDRVLALETQAAALRARIADLEWERGHLSRRGTATTAVPEARLQSRLVGLERRMRQLEDDLQERARREGALPGWLR
jgi:hypothetical protein